MANEMQANVMQKVAYHIDQGAVTMYAVDANNAVNRHPEEWSWTPWSADDASKYRAAREEQHKKETEDAKAAGLPPPAPLPPPPLEPSDREKVGLDADAKARAEAAEIVKKANEEAEKKRVEDEKIAAARALLSTPPQQPDPNERRPFGKPGAPTPKERALIDKRNAAKAEKDRADQAAKRTATQPTQPAQPAQPAETDNQGVHEVQERERQT